MKTFYWVTFVLIAAFAVGIGIWRKSEKMPNTPPLSEASKPQTLLTISEFRQLCRDGDARRVKAALAGGYPISERDAGGSSALHESVMHVDVCKILIESGIDVNVQRDFRFDGFTALHQACVAPADPLVVELLLKAGADPNILDSDGKKPIDYARKYSSYEGYPEKVKLLEQR